MNRKITLAVVDDQSLMRKGIIALLKSFDNIQVIIEAANGKELIEQLILKQPDVVLLDFEMPVMDGIVTTEILKEQYPQIKIIILTMHNEEGLLIDLVERGANGFLRKNEAIEKVVLAIESVLITNYYFDEKVSTAMAKRLVETKKNLSHHDYDNLSEREIEVIKLICKEHSNKEIAEIMFLSHRTIDNYREKLMQKIGAKNTAGIVMYALKHDLVSKESGS